MTEPTATPDELCSVCVYFPPNLPRHAYHDDDWAMLQSRACSFEHAPGSPACLDSRKTSCSLVDLSTHLPKVTPRS